MTEAPIIMRLTDEEVAVLAGVDGPGLLPVLAGMDDAERGVALRTAYRSLVARELVEPGPDAVDDARRGLAAGDEQVWLDVRLPEALAELLALRTGAARTVAVGRTTANGEDACYAYLSDGVALFEEVSTAGLHTFRLAEPDDAGDVVVEWSLTHQAGDGSGDPVVVGAEQASEADVDPGDLARIAAAHLRADVVVVDGGEEPRELLAVLSGPQETLVGDLVLGSGGDVRLVPVAAADAAARIRALVAGSVGQG